DKSLEAGRLTLIMAWETWWALVLGFTIAGAVEAWVPKERIVEHLKGAGPKELGVASFFGFVSSSCSFSAIAAAKNLFKKGASAAASLGAFMFAATNLVIEIGLVMWVLLGWQFVLADFIGGAILIILMAAAFRLFIPDKYIEQARENALGGKKAKDPVCGMEVQPTGAEYKIDVDGETYYFCSKQCRDSFEPEKESKEYRSIKDNLTTKAGWIRLAKQQLKEWSMLYEDIIIGFILAGIIGAFVPTQVWLSLFSGEAVLGVPLYIVWTSAVGAVVGVITFVCSVGNVPFAAILWNNGLPFGSVLSYIYADLIVPPIVDAYRKYYGKTFAVILSLTIFIAAVVTGVVVHFGFDLFNLIPTAKATIVEKRIKLNFKAVLNGVFTIVFFWLLWLSYSKEEV
ncbi:MAG: permease, partial [Candidatus Magasanikbacteria bacterium]